MDSDDLIILGVIGIAAYFIWTKGGVRETFIPSAKGTEEYLVEKGYAKYSTISPGYVVMKKNDILYKFNEKDLNSASPFERQLLKWGWNPGTVSNISKIRSTPATFINWVI